MSEMVEVFKNSHYSRGIKLYDSGLYTEAIAEFEYVLNEAGQGICPEKKLATFYLGEAYGHLARVHLRMNMLSRAEDELKFALTIHPEYADLQLNLAVAYYKQKRYGVAEEQVHRALVINPQYVRALLYRGLIILRQGNENGLADIAGAISMEPAYDDSRYDKALSLYRDGDTEAAMQLFEEIAELDLDQISFLIEKGVELIECRMYTDALDAFTEAAALAPNYADIRHYLGMAHSGLGMNDEAIQQFREAAKINPTFVAAHYNLALAYEKSGQRHLAIAELERVISLDPDHTPAIEILKKFKGKPRN